MPAAKAISDELTEEESLKKEGKRE